MAENALAALVNLSPKLDLVGPTVDDDIRRALIRWGAEAVKSAVERQTKSKRGRRPTKDWPQLRESIVADAAEWLSGGDPLSTRSNYAIAKQFADANPGHSHPATMKRIERKLAKERRWLMLATAENMGRSGYPHAAYLRTLEALSKIGLHEHWASTLSRAQATLADYETRTGVAPEEALSMDDVENASRNAFLPLNALSSGSTPSGLLAAYVASLGKK